MYLVDSNESVFKLGHKCCDHIVSCVLTYIHVITSIETLPTVDTGYNW